MSNTLEEIRPADGQRVPDNKAGSLDLKHIDKLDPEQRQWRDNVMKVLGLQSTSSQGRVLAGAIANAAVVENGGFSAEDKKRAKALQSTVVDAGTPPWKDAKKAERAGNAKVELDLLTIPEDQRKLKVLGGGINPSFFIERVDADGQTRHSFVCKPRGVGKDAAPSGGVKGGEVARESLVGRAAQLMTKTTGIDVGMPETHVITMDCKYIPGREDKAGQMVSCSAQEFRQSGGEMGTLSQTDKAKFAAKDVAGLAILDTMTLNTDRHSGNLMMGENNTLIPIDHGESFAERNEDGIDRIKSAMGGPHNALLALPGAHEPMSPEMIKQLSAMSADNFSKGLADDNAAIGKEYPDMAGMISKGAIENARRAARFVKLAVRNDPPLSPAAIQIAMGNAAEQLFGETVKDDVFEKRALEVIARAAPLQEVFKEVCTSSTPEYDKLVAKAKVLGWSVQGRTGAPNSNLISDPAVLMQIVAKDLRAPPKWQDVPAALKTMQAGPPVTSDEAMSAIMVNRSETIADLIAVMAANTGRLLTAKLREIKALPANQQKDSMDKLLVQAMDAAMKEQQRRLDEANEGGVLTELVKLKLDGFPVLLQGARDKFGNAEGGLKTQSPIEAKKEIDALIAAVANGDFLRAASNTVESNFRNLAAEATIPANDKDLKKGLSEAGKNDAVKAAAIYETLLGRVRGGAFGTDGLDAYVAQVDELETQFVIDKSSNNWKAVVEARLSDDIRKLARAVKNMSQSSWEGNSLPTRDTLDKMAAIWGIDAADPLLLQAQTDVQKGDLEAFKKSWDKLKYGSTVGDKEAKAILDQAAIEDAMTDDGVRSQLIKDTAQQAAADAKTRAKDAFKDKRRINAEKLITDITDVYDIPADHAALVEAKRQIGDGYVQFAMPLIDRLAALCKADVFPKL